MAKDPNFEEQVLQRMRLGVRNKWYCIGASAHVGDQPVALTRLGESLVVWRDSHGLVHVQEDRCPHRGAPLSLGKIAGDRIACRYHGVQIKGDGVVADVPAFEDCNLIGQKLVKSYPVIEHYQGIWAYFGDGSHPDPVPFTLPEEMTTDEWSGFIMSDTWNTGYLYGFDNFLDPMHAPYLHSDTFTLAYGSKKDEVVIDDTDLGFRVTRKEDPDMNIDVMDFNDTGGYWVRVGVYYPPAAGPGGVLRIIATAAPIDETHAQLSFWRMRKVSGWQGDMWRFLYKNRLEDFAWHVIEQDRELLEAMPLWPPKENLYQHDLGVARIRRTLRREAEAQIRALGDTEPAREGT